MASEREVTDALAPLVDYYDAGAKITPAQVQLYVRALADLDAGVLEEAAAEYVQTGKWFPKVSELREIAKRRHGAAAADSVLDDRENDAIRERGRELWGMYCYGEISQQELESDRAWIAYQKLLPHRPGPTPEEQARLDAIWEQAQVVSAQWMTEDYGPDWRQSPPASMMQGAEV